MSFNVYLAESLGGGTSDHHAIFVEGNLPSDGVACSNTLRPARFLYQVKGSIAQGMTYEFRDARDDDVCLARTLLGTVDGDDFNCIDRICSAVPPPKKQFHGPKRLFPRQKLYKCQAWTRDALAAMERGGILRNIHGVPWQDIHEARRTETWSI